MFQPDLGILSPITITVKNLTINNLGSLSEGCGNIFTNCAGIEQKNVNYVISQCVANWNSGMNNYCGGLVGQYFAYKSEYVTLIEKCYSSGLIAGDDSGGIGGYLFAYLSSGTHTIKECYTTGQISGDYSGGA